MSLVIRTQFPLGGENNSCSICIEDFQPLGQTVTHIPLERGSHYFHEDCLKRWVLISSKSTCPNCNTPINPLNILTPDEQNQYKNKFKIDPMTYAVQSGLVAVVGVSLAVHDGTIGAIFARAIGSLLGVEAATAATFGALLPLINKSRKYVLNPAFTFNNSDCRHFSFGFLMGGMAIVKAVSSPQSEVDPENWTG